MLDEERIRRIEEERYFRYEGLTYEENKFYLQLISCCKDVQNPANLPEGVRGELVEIMMRKEGELISFNGSLAYNLSEDKYEYRSIIGDIWEDKGLFVVDAKVERLAIDTPNKTYTTLDKFEVKEGKIVSRKSYYNYEMPKTYKNDMDTDLGGMKL